MVVAAAGAVFTVFLELQGYSIKTPIIIVIGVVVNVNAVTVSSTILHAIIFTRANATVLIIIPITTVIFIVKVTAAIITIRTKISISFNASADAGLPYLLSHFLKRLSLIFIMHPRDLCFTEQNGY